MLEPGLAYAVGVPGLALTTAGNASVISAMEPVFIVGFAWAKFSVRPRPAVVGATLAAVAGVVMLSAPDLMGTGAGSLAGDLLVLIGTAFAARYVLGSSRLVATMSPLALTTLATIDGTARLPATTIALLSGYEHLPTAVPLKMLLLAILSRLVQYALAFWLYLVGLRHLPVGTAGLFLALSPIFGVAGGMIFLGERATTLQLAGALLIIVAVMALVGRAGETDTGQPPDISRAPSRRPSRGT